ncbi:MAG TPA: hypothetical protein PKC98_16290 [Candidatus Melainabacteria bacterium]|nr:hypothetical protein [Candidatus Melainabacteria bacterium]
MNDCPQNCPTALIGIGNSLIEEDSRGLALVESYQSNQGEEQKSSACCFLLDNHFSHLPAIIKSHRVLIFADSALLPQLQGSGRISEAGFEVIELKKASLQEEAKRVKASHGLSWITDLLLFWSDETVAYLIALGPLFQMPAARQAIESLIEYKILGKRSDI